MKKVQVVVLMILLIACQPSVDVQLTATSNPKPTNTRIPPTATVTPFPPLAEEGPYLALQPGFQNTTEIILYNRDGTGRQIVKLPENINPRVSVKNISPDGNWLAFHTGSVNIGGEIDNLPVTLHIMNIDNGQIIKVADIVEQGYWEKLVKIATELKLHNPDLYNESYDPDWVEGSVVRHFQWSIYSLSWSPNSKFLAFASQIDGISSDVYIYDVETGLIHRLEESLQNVLWIDWSPDGQYVIFHNSIPGNVYTGSDFYAIKATSEKIINPKPFRSGFWHTTLEWLSPTTILITGTTDTAGKHSLQKLDIVTGRTTNLWGDYYGGYAIDYDNQVIAFTASEFASPENFGFYYVTFDGKRKKLLDGLYWVDVLFRGSGKNQFLINGGNHDDAEYNIAGNTVGISLNEISNLLDVLDFGKTMISPDYTWLLTYDEEKIYLYNENDELTNTFLISGVYSVIWCPDSKGFFYATGRSLYYFDMQNMKPVFVDTYAEDYPFRFDGNEFFWTH